MINVGIIGATGYTGEELIEILLGHPQVRIAYLAAKIEKAVSIGEIFPKFKKRINLTCEPADIDSAILKCNLLFLALPHTVSMAVAPKLLKANKRVIDLSADYRLRNVKIYERFYKSKHNDVRNLKTAVYGLPEIYRQAIKKAKLVANPGCYPTAAILGLAPLVACGVVDSGRIIIDAKSGVTGSGRRALLEYNFSEINGDAFAYKMNVHQHTPEINQELSRLAGRAIKVVFVPHLLSISRGILETIYIEQSQKSKSGKQRLVDLYKNFYKNEPFVRIKEQGQCVRIKDVVNSNFCDITVKSFPKQNLVVIVSAIDNLDKGAASQAVQNMNIMYGFPEKMGLV